MGFGEAIRSCLQKNYVGFEGRAPRSEYWFFALFIWLIMLALIVPAAVFYNSGGAMVFFALIGLLGLAVFLPSLAVSIRRLHDTNASGWWYLLAFIPYAGGLIMLVWFCLPGTKGDNRFGPDLLESAADAFS